MSKKDDKKPIKDEEEVKSEKSQNIQEKDTVNSEIVELKEQNLRLAAQIQNLHKQQELEIAQNVKKGKKIVSLNALTFLSTLNISFAYTPENLDQKTEKFVETLKNSYEKLKVELKKGGVELIIPTVGEDFDPNTMSSLNPTEDEEPTVKNIASLGVIIDGQLVQPASVML